MERLHSEKKLVDKIDLLQLNTGVQKEKQLKI